MSPHRPPDPSEAEILDEEPAGAEWLDDGGAATAHDEPPRVRVDPHDTRPEIIVSGELHEVVEECVHALAGTRANGHAHDGTGGNGDPNLFQRAHELVTVARYRPSSAASEKGAPVVPGQPAVFPVEQSVLALRLSRYARLLRVAKPTAQEKASAAMGHPAPVRYDRVQVCPAPISAAIIASRDWPAVRPLVGITETPILRPDGTIAAPRRDRATYDWPTGYLLVPGIDLPDLPTEPTQDDAIKALEVISEPFADFPFASPSARMVPVAAILTLLARPAIRGACPMIVFDASTRGSGKTKLAEIVSRIALGRSAARKTLPEQDEELDKLLASYAIAGSPLVLLDNATRPIGGGTLDACITADDDVELRVLGRSEVKRLPWRALILATGNNVALGEDTMRRVMVCRLEPDVEDPEMRTGWRHPDILGWVTAHRPQLVTAALTILRAYTAHGRPDAGLGVWGSFEAWSSLVPSAITFAGGADPMLARPRGEAAMTDEMAALGCVLRDLPRISTEPLSSREICELLWPHGRPPEAPDGWDDLRAALEVIAPGRGGPPSAKGVGERLRRAIGRVIGGRRLMCEFRHGHVRTWNVVSV